MVQVPTATRVTVDDETVQIDVVCDEKLIGRPEDAVALTVNGAVPNVSFASVPNVMVWDVSACAAPSHNSAAKPTRPYRKEEKRRLEDHHAERGMTLRREHCTGPPCHLSAISLVRRPIRNYTLMVLATDTALHTGLSATAFGCRRVNHRDECATRKLFLG